MSARLLSLLLLLGAGLTASPLDDRPWFYRPVVEPTAADPEPKPEAWRPVLPVFWPTRGFSLVHQRRDEGAPHPFEPGADSREMLERDWELATTFELKELPAGRFDLVSDSSSPLVEVYLNAELVGRLDRPFAENDIGERRVDLKSKLKVGRNDLLLRILAPGPEAARRHAAMPRNLPDGPAVTVRAPRMIFGTEVAPPLVSAWLEVAVDDRESPVRLLRSRLLESDKGRSLEAEVDITEPCEGRLVILSTQMTPRKGQWEKGEQAEVAAADLPMKAGRHVLTLPLPPPTGLAFALGKPLKDAPRTYIEVEFRLAGRDPYDDRPLFQGFHSFVSGFNNSTLGDLRLDPGASDRPAALVSEGRRHPIRGLTIVPSSLESGPPSFRTNTSWSMVERHRQEGFNLYRIWGGGGPASWDLLNSCMANGIAVWIELPFVRGLFPGDEAFLAEAEREVDEYLCFLQRYPCVVAISGSAETAVYRQGDIAPGLRSAKETAEVRADQARLFDQRLRALVARRLPKATYLPYGETLGSGDLTVRSLVSAPAPVTAARWKLGNGLRWPDGKSRELELGLRMGEAGLRPADPELIAFASRWLQAEDLRLRLDKVRAKGPEQGFVLWHLNDGWPGATSSLVDEQRVEKPAYFIARRANGPDGVRLAYDGAAAIAQATGKTIDLSLRILDAGGRPLQVQQGPGPLRAGFPPGAAYAVAENGPHRVIRPLPSAFLPDDPRLGKSAYKITSEAPKTADFFLSHVFTVTAEGVVVGLCLEPTAEFAWIDDGMIDLLPGERHTFRGRFPPEYRDWRQAYRARSWHDLR